MTGNRELMLIPDWPRVMQLVAKHLSKTEEEVQAMRDSADSLDQVELVMAMEEALDVRLPQ